MVLGSDDLDAKTAAEWGYLNRALPEGELDNYVDALAWRIASFPAQAIAMAKQSVNNAELPLQEGLAEEAFLFQQTLRTAGAQRNMKKFLEMGGQTREAEMRMGDLCRELGEATADEQ